MVKSILDTEKNICYLCGHYGQTHLHHIFGAANRNLSTADGLVVYLCPVCHELVHNNRPDLKEHLQHIGQTEWEHYYGNREAFIKRYGKSWILKDNNDYRKE